MLWRFITCQKDVFVYKLLITLYYLQI